MDPKTSEPGDAGFSPADAARDLQALRAFDVGLRQRTEGISWALWGLVTAGIFLTYGYAGSHFGHAWPFWATQIWLPWVAAGSALSAALWRSAALTAPAAAERGVRGWIHLLTWTLLILAVICIAFFLRTGIREPVMALLGVGAVALFMGATNLLRYTPTGRLVAVTAGAAMVGAALLEVLLDAGYDAATLVGATVGGCAFLLGGLYETLRG